MLKRSFVFASLVVASSAHAVVLYDNTNTPTDTSDFFSTSRNAFADDFDVSSALVGTNPVTQITGIDFGYELLTDGASFDVAISIYQNISLTATDSVNSVLSNKVFSQTFSFTNVALAGQGNKETGLLSLGTGFTLPAISNYATMNHGIEVHFYKPGTTILSTDAVGLFKGDIPPTVGSSDSTYYRDVNGDGIFTGNERIAATSSALRNNYYFSLVGTATPVPEPSAFAALGLGAVAVLRRRKRA